MSSARASELFAKLADTDDNVELNAVLTELGGLMESDPSIRDFLVAHREELLGRYDVARISVASVSARLAAANLVVSDVLPYEPDTNHPEFSAAGPATEIALAALHILKYAGTMLPLDGEFIDRALDEPPDTDFGSYPAISAAAVAHLETAAYYLLDPADSHDALASEPPDQETFPPLPFPRIWLEMTHLSPYMRYRDNRESRDSRWRDLEILGIAIAEIEQGTVWDVYVAFMFDTQAEFFFLAQRISPLQVIAADSDLGSVTEPAFEKIRALAVGGVHVITARNVPVESVTLPRHQRKRLPAVFQGRQPSLYYVNLSRSGEHEAGDGSREYRVRWLVRGHWRHTLGGKTFCTCCQPRQIASWVAPYVKGPVGAPWKGRQVRRSEATA